MVCLRLVSPIGGSNSCHWRRITLIPFGLFFAVMLSPGFEIRRLDAGARVREIKGLHLTTLRQHVAALHVHTFQCTHLQSIFNSIARNYPITATNCLATSFGKPPLKISCTANRSADQKAPFCGHHMSLPIETHLAKL